MYKFSLILLLNPWIRPGRDTKCQSIKSLFPLGMKLGTKLTEVKFVMHIISLHDVRCLDGQIKKEIKRLGLQPLF